MRYLYLLDKIMKAPVLQTPFRHIQIDDFFEIGDFERITSVPEIALETQPSDEALFATLFEAGYKIIDFPGCITNQRAYLRWHRDKSQTHRFNNTACEGFGMTLRLTEPRSEVLRELMSFLQGSDFQAALASRFGIPLEQVSYDAGIQKYLDGYEISPHPDMRKKALTYMVNINPDARSAQARHHTHYLRFKDQYRYVQSYWEGNPTQDRCWVPWDWCESEKVQNQNNSIVIFSPGNDTMHGVKADYDHLQFQRTQLYGNLWYRESEVAGNPMWENFVVKPGNPQPRSLRGRAAAALPAGLKAWLKATLFKGSSSHYHNHKRKL